MFETNNQKNIADPVSLDSFGWLRVSNRATLFDRKHLYSKDDGVNGPLVWEYKNTNNGSSAYVSDEVSVDLTTTTTDTDKAEKVSRIYVPYTPGKAQLVIITAVVGKGELNNTKRLGQFDDLDGLFFCQIDGNFGVCVRTSTSGSAVDMVVPRLGSDGWNVDKLDGKGPSGVDLDITKEQLFFIDYEWLSGGEVRFCMKFGGLAVLVHVIKNANILALPYMKFSTLPVKFEIENTGVTTQSNTLKTICATVISEGGKEPSGPSFVASNGGVLREDITDREPVLAIRLKDAFEGKPNRVIVKFEQYKLYCEDKSTYFEIVQVSNPTTVTGDFVSLKNKISCCEISTNVSEVTGTEHLIDETIVPAGGNQKQEFIKGNAASIEDPYHFISQNIGSDGSQYFVVFATSVSGIASKVHATIIEQEIQ